MMTIEEAREAVIQAAREWRKLKPGCGAYTLLPDGRQECACPICPLVKAIDELDAKERER